MGNIDNLREAMGTLPSQFPENITQFVRGCERMRVTLIDWSKNPMKAMVSASTATWGDDRYEDKWLRLTPENRYRVVLAVLTGNTLPQALESVQFVFKVEGTPRHCFDQHARARIGTVFFSIGARDNCKLDSAMILYTKLYDKYFQNGEFRHFFYQMKDLYGKIIKDKGSWQIARAIIPMCYHHPYHFAQNLLGLQGQCNNRMMFHEEEFIVALHWLIREEIKTRISPLIANYLRPACDRAKKCLYSKSYALSNAFGCLFAGCGRWPAGTEYATFNESCSDILEIEKQLNIHIPRPDEWIEYTEADYTRLSIKDRELFQCE
jgi:hypothetical protein